MAHSEFEKLICDLQCIISATERSYKYDGQRPLSLLVFRRAGDPSTTGHWISRALPSRLAYRLLIEIEHRGFYGVRLECVRSRPIRTIVLDTLRAYKQRRLGLALLRHRSALPVVAEAGDLGELYQNAGLCLQESAVASSVSWGKLRRAEKFAKYVRLSAYNTLLARDLETLQ